MATRAASGTDGVVITATAAFSREQGLAPWWLGVLQGSFAATAGVLLIAAAGGGSEALLQPLGWYWLAAGVLGLVRLFADHTLWGVRAAASAIGLALGTWILESPAPIPLWPAAGDVWAVGLAAIALGAAETVGARASAELPLYALGVLDVLIGLVLVFDPLPAVEPGILLGLPCFAIGAAAVSIGLGVRWPKRRLAGPDTGPDHVEGTPSVR